MGEIRLGVNAATHKVAIGIGQHVLELEPAQAADLAAQLGRAAVQAAQRAYENRIVTAQDVPKGRAAP